MKISKKAQKDQKYQFQSLIKVLKPKVYITESSNFKRLVQELTGDGDSSTWSPPSMESSVTKGSSVREDNNSVHWDQAHHHCHFQSRSRSTNNGEISSANNSSFTFDHLHQQQSEYQYQYQYDQYEQYDQYPYHSCSVEVSDSINASMGSPVSSYITNASDQEYDLSNLLFGDDDTALQAYMANELVDFFPYQEIESFLMDD